MRNLLEMIYEHQLLRSKERDLDIALDPAERVRMMGLHRLLQGETPDPQNRVFARVRMSIPVQFTRPGGFESGEIRDLGGGGFLILTSKAQDVGTRIIIRIEDPQLGCEYVFPCVVKWRAKRGPGRMGVALDGVPNRGDLYEESTGVWRKSLRLGEDPADPMVA
ncbi:MAG: PilZ domain-containing protein [Myxococcales bacterium]|nr:PilZ domain-containing protein [Myxococcales bacterium]